jgi:hypothetical protein
MKLCLEVGGSDHGDPYCQVLAGMKPSQITNPAMSYLI